MNENPATPIRAATRAPLARIGVDTGGTFTDCVVMEGGDLRVLKVFTTPDDPVVGIVDGVRALLADRRPPRLEILHGTTVGTNTLLERKGARVALVTTAGFEDLIELGRQNRPQLYDFAVRREPPLVPAERRVGVRERTAADGSVLSAPSAAELRRLVARLKKDAPEALALCFLFSYANPANERAVAAWLGKLGLPLSVSHELLPEFREYERTSTVVMNAYLAPRLGAYLARLATAFDAAHGFKGHAVRISVMQSSGGVTTAERAAREPVRTILSGPAGGVVATARLAERLGIQRAISFDMGGTSTDVSLIDGAPRTTRETTLGGLPVAVPVLEVHSVGAGGGSLVRIDAGGALRVGPESAGAVPGPACYGRGGERPTVTDAHLVLGRLDPDYFLGGTFRLDAQAAADAFARFLKDESRRGRSNFRTPMELARGIVAVANATMERALRVISVERGHDPRGFTLVTFGGAGGLHAADLARTLGLEQVVVPRHPGAFSAFGVLVSDIVKDLSHSILVRAPSETAAAERRRFLRDLARRFASMEAAGRVELRGEGYAGRATAERRLDLRYAGQSYELSVPFSLNFSRDFEREHERAYGHAEAGRPIEVVNLKLRLAIKTTPDLSAKSALIPETLGPPAASVLKRKAMVFGADSHDAPLYDREQLPPGTRFRGPAVVIEYSSTTVVPPDYQGRVDGDGNLILTRSAD